MKKYLIVAAVVILGVFLYLGFLRHPDVSIEKTEEAGAAAETMLKEIVTNANGKGIILYINDSPCKYASKATKAHNIIDINADNWV